MRYKEGDKVVIRNDLNINEEYGYYKVDKNMEKYIGKTVTIEKVWDDTYVTVEKPSGDFFTDEMIDHEATARLNQTKPFDINEEFEKIAIELLTNNIEEMQNSNPTIKVKIGDKIIYSKGGETMNANEILEKWRNKKADELISQRDAEIKKVTKEDEIQKLVEEHETEINKIIKDKYKIDTQVSQIFCTITTRKTGDKIEAINKEFDKKVAELDEKEEEIKAVLEVAENQDKVFEILNKQGIIDKNYNIL